MIMLLLMMMMIIGITLRDLVHAIPYYTIKEGMMMRMMMILTIYHHPIMTITIYLPSIINTYHHLLSYILVYWRSRRKTRRMFSMVGS
jgi:hypothetical protein